MSATLAAPAVVQAPYPTLSPPTTSSPLTPSPLRQSWSLPPVGTNDNSPPRAITTIDQQLEHSQTSQSSASPPSITSPLASSIPSQRSQLSPISPIDSLLAPRRLERTPSNGEYEDFSPLNPSLSPVNRKEVVEKEKAAKHGKNFQTLLGALLDGQGLQNVPIYTRVDEEHMERYRLSRDMINMMLDGDTYNTPPADSAAIGNRISEYTLRLDVLSEIEDAWVRCCVQHANTQPLTLLPSALGLEPTSLAVDGYSINAYVDFERELILILFKLDCDLQPEAVSHVQDLHPRRLEHWVRQAMARCETVLLIGAAAAAAAAFMQFISSGIPDASCTYLGAVPASTSLDTAIEADCDPYDDPLTVLADQACAAAELPINETPIIQPPTRRSARLQQAAVEAASRTPDAKEAYSACPDRFVKSFTSLIMAAQHGADLGLHMLADAVAQMGPSPPATPSRGTAATLGRSRRVEHCAKVSPYQKRPRFASPSPGPYVGTHGDMHG